MSSVAEEGGTRYLVLEIDRDAGLVRIAHESVVDYELPAEAPLPDPERGWLIVNSVDGEGRVIRQDVIRGTGLIRGEFHGADGGIEAHFFEQKVVYAVVRVPLATRLVRVSDGGAIAQSLVLSPFAPTAKQNAATVIRARRAGPPENRVDLLIVGEGYTIDERRDFERDLDRFREEFFAISPYREYVGFVNVSGLFVPSPESGADVPPFRAGCGRHDPTCCPDSSAPRGSGTFVDTAFDGRFCTAGIQRLLTVSAGKVYEAAAAAPEWDLIGVIVNSERYGGSGGSVWTASTHELSTQVAQHEYGHSFTGLADEYTVPFPGFPPCSDRGGLPSCEPNVTDETARSLLKWRARVDDRTPIPTPPTMTDVVGLFEGARYEEGGMFRPEFDCMMNGLVSEFCEVCAEAYVRRLYAGEVGFFRGIELIDRGSFSPEPGAVQGEVGAELTLTATPVHPSSDTPLSMIWRVDGSEVATGESLTIVPGSEGIWYVELELRDRSSFLAPDEQPVFIAKWVIVVGEQPQRRRPAGR